MNEHKRGRLTSAAILLRCLSAACFLSLIAGCAVREPALILPNWNRTRQPLPNVLELSSENGSLLYVGAMHTLNPAHPQFAVIEACWSRFHPDLAFSEGCIWPLESSRELAVHRHGEQGLLRWLAARDGVSIRCLDPSLVQQALHLKRRFPPGVVMLYYVLREAAVRRRIGLDFRIEIEVLSLQIRLSRVPGFGAAPRNPDALHALFRRMFPWVGDWTDVPAEFFYREEAGGILARIHRSLNLYRDRVMFGKMSAAFEKGRRVFAVVGRRHLIEQESALRAMVAATAVKKNQFKSIRKKDY